jgi:photosystem II stability/assembly factor-like uncharacterized protein
MKNASIRYFLALRTVEDAQSIGAKFAYSLSLVSCLLVISPRTSPLRAQNVWVGGGNAADIGVDLVHTTDGGTNWTAVDFAGSPFQINASTFVDADHGWLGGNYVNANFAVWHTTDGGFNWTLQQVPGSSVLALSFVNENTGWAVSRFEIYRTDDGGENWVTQVANTGGFFPVFAALNGGTFVDANNGWVVSPQGYIGRTSDGGENWELQFDGSGSVSLIALDFLNENSGWVVGSSGQILYTDDGGSTWSPQTSNTTRHLRAVDFVDTTHGWAVGDLGTITHTADGGTTWSVQSSATMSSLWGVGFADANTGWAVGELGTILHTIDGGATWSPQVSGTDHQLRTVDIVMAGANNVAAVWSVALGNWSVGSNWEGGFVPDAAFDEAARIANGGTAQISSAVPSVVGVTVAVGSLQILTGGSIAISGGVEIESAGSLSIDGAGAQLTATSVNVAGIATVANGAMATFSGSYTQTGGATTLDGGNLEVAMMQLQGGVLAGKGTITGNVTNAARIAPGFSPEIINIDGEYTQEATGVLDIEIGGLTPGPTGHDQLVVTGAATLAGRLDLSLINPETFTPVADDHVDILTAASVSGVFDSIFFANPPNGLAVEVNYSTTAVEVRLVPTTSTSYLPPPAGIAAWSNTEIWQGQILPDSSDDVTIASDPSGMQQLNVDIDVIVRSAMISGQIHPMIVNVQNGIHLSATHGVAIGNLGRVRLDSGTLVASSIQIASGGLIVGTGDIVGNVTNAGMLNPGFAVGVGVIDIDGDYTQTAAGTLLIEVEGTAAGQADRVDVTGQLELDGTLRIVVTHPQAVQAGDTITLLTAGSFVTGSVFQRVETIGADDLYFAVDYPNFGIGSGDDEATTLAVGATGYELGDMNRSGGQPDTEDIRLFALALVNDAAYRARTTPNGACICQDGWAAGDFTEDFRLDVDDIAGFANKLGMSTAALAAAIKAYNQGVPEPSAAALLLSCSCGVLMRRRYRQHRTRRDS